MKETGIGLRVNIGALYDRIRELETEVDAKNYKIKQLEEEIEDLVNTIAICY